MTSAASLSFILSLAVLLTAPYGRQGTDDPKLHAAVERFFAMQQAEDVTGYLSLWSTKVERPTAAQLKYVFESGDDTFSDITVIRAFPAGDRVRVRVSATRDRVTPARIPGRPPFTSHSTTTWVLVYVSEDDEWKLVREGSAADDLADRIAEAPTPAAREELLIAEPELVNDALIMALSRRAGQAAQEKNYPAAQAGFERMLDVARHVGNKRLEGEALQNLANAKYFQRNLQGALEAYEARLPLERERQDQSGTAAALLGIATIRYSFSEYATALTTYREALVIQERLDDTGAMATTLISTGNVLYLQGDYSAAIADYTRSRDLNRALPNAAGEADALEGLGRVFMAQGNYRAALDALNGVLAEGRARNDRNDQGAALLSIGDVLFRLGNLDGARSALVESRAHFEAVKHLSHAGRAWQGLALVDLVASRFTLAEDEYRKSSDSCAVAGDLECVAAAAAGLAFAQTAQDKFTEGIASYKKAIEGFTSLKRPEPAARAEIGLSRALAGSGAYAAALDAASHARGVAAGLPNDDVLWRALVAEAEALRHLRDRPKAIAAATEAVAAVDRLLEIAKIRPSAPVARDTSSAFATLALLQAEDGDAAAAFESAERMRAHDLRVLLAPGERDISRGMTDAERETERALVGDLVSLHAQLTRERGLPKPDSVRIARLDTTIAEATTRRAAQQQSLFERLPALRTWRGLAPAATRADVEVLLPDTRTLHDAVRRRRGNAAGHSGATSGGWWCPVLDPIRGRLAQGDRGTCGQADGTRHAARRRCLAKGRTRAHTWAANDVRHGDPRDRHPPRGALARALRGASRRDRICWRHDLIRLRALRHRACPDAAHRRAHSIAPPSRRGLGAGTWADGRRRDCANGAGMGDPQRGDGRGGNAGDRRGSRDGSCADAVGRCRNGGVARRASPAR